MSWFFDAAPYVLAGGAIILSALEILKNWKEYKQRWVRMTVASVFVVVAVVSILALRHDSVEKASAAGKADADMKRLQDKVDAANQAQKDNTKLFLLSLGRMSDQVSDLKTEVKTEALQKKLASVQAELQNTQKALAPGPKAELAFSFPVVDVMPSGRPAAPVTKTTLPRNQDGSVHAEFFIINPTAVDAVDISVDLRICAMCKYAKESPGLKKVEGLDETVRVLNISILHAREAYQMLSIDVSPPPSAEQFIMGFTYRCHTCVLHEDVVSGIVYVRQP